MADNSAGTQYYRTTLAGLSVVVGDPKDGEVAPEVVRFEAFEERIRGEKQNVGYLATDDQRAIRKLANDANVEKINAKEYKDATEGDGVKRAAL